MTRIILMLAAAFALAWSPLALAHGPESHEEDSAVAAKAEAPAASDSDADDGAQASTGEHAGKTAPRVTVASVLENLHPATVHFPIGLLIAAALVELLAIRRRSERLAQAATVMVAAGAIGAVIAAVFGWIHTGIWFGGGGTIQWHRWLGTNLAVLALLTWWASRRPEQRKVFRVLLFATAALVSVQGYLGAELAHGPNHLAEGEH